MNKNKVYLTIAAVIIGLMVLAMILPFIFMPRISKEERADIINTFDGFENQEGLIFTDGDRIFLPDKTINVNDIEYNGKQCYLIECCKEVFYAYAFDKQGTSLHLLEIDYDLNEIKYIDTINGNLSRNAFSEYSEFYLRNKIYLGVFKDNYYVYDLAEKTYTVVSKAEVKAMRETQRYSFNIVESGTLINRRYHSVQITDNATQELKEISMDNLNGFAEGEYILSLDLKHTKLFFSKIIEINGEIYILGMISLDSILSSEWECVILKYDFGEERLSYYSSMHYDWDEVPGRVYVFNG